MSLRILFATDIHLRAIKPISRLDVDFLGTIIGKIDQVREMSENFDIVVLGGDIFDRPDAAHSVVSRAINAFAKFKKPVYSIVGQHDIYGYQGQTLDRTAMGVLIESGVIKKLDSVFMNNVAIYGLHAYDTTVWEVPESVSTKVLVAHKLLTNNPFPGGVCHLISDVVTKTNANLILSGDIHYPHEVELNDRVFINSGSLSRLSITDRDRFPQVAEITIEDTGEINYNLRVLDSRPAETVFDLLNYSNRLASEEHTATFMKTYAHAVISVKAEAHLLAPMLEKFLMENGVEARLHTMVDDYRDRAEKEVLEEMKD
jgi:DNA repair exonuclease SbcCD nuclease subunit